MDTFTPETICHHLPLNPGSCKEVFAGRAERHRQGAWSLVFLTGRQADITWRAAAHWYTSVIDWDRLRRAVAPRASKMPQPVAVNPYFPTDIDSRALVCEMFRLAREFFPHGELETWLFCPRRAAAGLYTPDEIAAAVDLGDRLMKNGSFAFNFVPKTRARLYHFCQYFRLPRSPIGSVQKGTLDQAKAWFARPCDAAECAKEVATMPRQLTLYSAAESDMETVVFQKSGPIKKPETRPKIQRYLKAMKEVDNVAREHKTKQDLSAAEKYLKETREVLEEVRNMRRVAVRAEMMKCKDAAAYLNISTRMIDRWRFEGGGPKFVRYGKRGIRYRKSDLDAFIEQSTRHGGA